MAGALSLGGFAWMLRSSFDLGAIWVAATASLPPQAFFFFDARELRSRGERIGPYVLRTEALVVAVAVMWAIMPTP